MTICRSVAVSPAMQNVVEYTDGQQSAVFAKIDAMQTALAAQLDAVRQAEVWAAEWLGLRNRTILWSAAVSVAATVGALKVLGVI